MAFKIIPWTELEYNFHNTEKIIEESKQSKDHLMVLAEIDRQVELERIRKCENDDL